MPAENELLVRIVGDASDLQAKFEVAQAQVASTSAAMAGTVAEANSEVAASTAASANEVFVAGEKEVAAIASVKAAFASAIAPAVEANAEIGGSTEAAAVAVGSAAERIRAYFTNIKTAFVEGAEVAKLSTLEIRESMMEATTVARESETKMGGLLAGGLSLGGVATAAIGVTMLTEAIHHTAESTIELGHLSEITGIAVSKLAGLRLMAQETGVDFDQFSNQMIKMLRAQEKTSEEGKAQVHALQEIGLAANAIDGKSAEEALNIISGAMQKTTSEAALVDAATVLFSKSGARAIPIFKEYGDQLGTVMEQQGKLTNVTDDSVRAAKDWLKNEADMENTLKAGLMPLFPAVTNVIMGMVGALDTVALAFHVAFDALWTPIAALTAGLGHIGTALLAATSGDWSKVGSESAAAAKAFEDRWKASIDAVNAHRDRVAKEFAIGEHPAQEAVHEGTHAAAPHSTGKAFMAKAEEDFTQLKLSHKLTVAEEKQFWQDRLAEADKGSEAYLAIEKKLGALNQHGPGAKPKHDFAMGDNAMQGVKFGQIEEQGEDKVIAAITAEWKKGYDADLEMQKRQLAAKSTANEGYLDKIRAQEQLAEHNANLGGIQEKIGGVQNAASLGQIGKGQELQQLQQLHQQMAAENDRYLQQEAQQFSTEPLKRMQIDEQIAANHRKSLEQQAHDTTAILQQQQQKYQQVFGLIGSNFKTALNGVLQGTQTMGQAFSKMFLSIELGLAEFVINWLAKKAEMWAMDKIMHLTGVAEKRAVDATAGVATVTTDAAVAAAGAMAYYSAINPPMAPAMAALQFAETMSWAGAAAFEMGGIVAGGVGQAVPIVAHAGERVLSRPQTERFEQMVNSDGGGKGNTVNLHYNGQVNAFDRTGMRNTLNSHAEDITSIIRQAMRDGKLTV